MSFVIKPTAPESRPSSKFTLLSSKSSPPAPRKRSADKNKEVRRKDPSKISHHTSRDPRKRAEAAPCFNERKCNFLRPKWTQVRPPQPRNNPRRPPRPLEASGIQGHLPLAALEAPTFPKSLQARKDGVGVSPKSPRRGRGVSAPGKIHLGARVLRKVKRLRVSRTSGLRDARGPATPPHPGMGSLLRRGPSRA